MTKWTPVKFLSKVTGVDIRNGKKPRDTNTNNIGEFNFLKGN